MYTYIEQMWRLSASERAELKVKRGHTSRFARDIRTNTRGMLLGSYILVYGGLKLISRKNIPYLLANHRGLRVQRRLLPANEFPWNSRARIPRCGATAHPEEKRGASGIPGALNKIAFAGPRSEEPPRSRGRTIAIV